MKAYDSRIVLFLSLTLLFATFTKALIIPSHQEEHFECGEEWSRLASEGAGHDADFYGDRPHEQLVFDAPSTTKRFDGFELRPAVTDDHYRGPYCTSRGVNWMVVSRCSSPTAAAATHPPTHDGLSWFGTGHLWDALSSVSPSPSSSTPTSSHHDQEQEVKQLDALARTDGFTRLRSENPFALHPLSFSSASAVAYSISAAATSAPTGLPMQDWLCRSRASRPVPDDPDRPTSVARKLSYLPGMRAASCHCDDKDVSVSKAKGVSLHPDDSPFWRQSWAFSTVISSATRPAPEIEVLSSSFSIVPTATRAMKAQVPPLESLGLPPAMWSSAHDVSSAQSVWSASAAASSSVAASSSASAARAASERAWSSRSSAACASSAHAAFASSPWAASASFSFTAWPASTASASSASSASASSASAASASSASAALAPSA